MAKSKPAKAAKPKSPKPAKAEKIVAGRGFEPDAEAARNPGVMSSVEIGHVAEIGRAHV